MSLTESEAIQLCKKLIKLLNMRKHTDEYKMLMYGRVVYNYKMVVPIELLLTVNAHANIKSRLNAFFTKKELRFMQSKITYYTEQTFISYLFSCIDYDIIYEYLMTWRWMWKVKDSEGNDLYSISDFLDGFILDNRNKYKHAIKTAKSIILSKTNSDVLYLINCYLRGIPTPKP